MTRDQQLELIRRKCIEGKPEIVDQHSIDCDMDESGGFVRRHRGCVVRAIRLSDLLFALESNHREDYAIISNGFFLTWRTDNRFGQDGDWKLASTEAHWNLRKDDLTEQSDECVAFLADLLK